MHQARAGSRTCECAGVSSRSISSSHAGDVFAERQRTGAAEEQALLHIARRGRGQLRVDAELPPAGQAVTQAALGQAVEGQRAARLLVGLGFQPRQESGERCQVVMPPACERDTVSITIRKPSLIQIPHQSYIDGGFYDRVTGKEKTARP